VYHKQVLMSRSTADRVYRAISDPTRRAILDLLAGSEKSVKELTAEFSMSQPAISQHLGELKSAKLVAARRVHRENRYRLTARPLAPVLTWLDRYRRFVDPAGHHWAIGPSQAPMRKE
jgi:DNA-binding transcriptional ArsR family regulator